MIIKNTTTTLFVCLVLCLKPMYSAGEDTGEDRIITSSRSIFNPCIPGDGNSVAFITVETVDSQSIDNIWIYSLEEDSLRKISSYPSKPKSGCELQWSPGDSCIGVFYAPGYPPNGNVFAIDVPNDIHEVSGKNFCWLSYNRLLFGQRKDIFIYDLNTRASTLFIENASRPAYLRTRN